MIVSIFDYKYKKNTKHLKINRFITIYFKNCNKSKLGETKLYEIKICLIKQPLI